MGFSHFPEDIPTRNTRTPQIIPILPVVAQTICKCLDGGEKSCIGADGIISADDIACAVRKAWGRHSDDIRIGLAMSSPINKEEVINLLALKYNIHLSTTARDELLSMNISDQSELIDAICHMIGALDSEVVRSYLLHEITAGDEIVMNSLAERYRFSTPGSKGIVLSRNGDEVIVDFSYLAGSPEKQARYEVDIDAMDAIFTSIDLSNTVKHISREEEPAPPLSTKELKKIRGIIERLVMSSAQIEENSNKQRFEDLLMTSGMLVPHSMNNEASALNRNILLSAVEPTIQAAYENRTLYSPSGSEVPPAERKPGTIAFELSEGCDHGQCTFCDLYGNTSFKTKSPEDFQQHVEAVMNAIGPEATDRIRRVFIGGGNALSAEQNTLESALRHIHQQFSPRRIALYGRTAAILQKKESGLRALKAAGLDMIYLGIESGSNDALRLVQKGNTAEATIRAAKLAETAKIDLSVTVMLGLGGEALSEKHAIETAKLLNQIKTKYITFLTITTPENVPYAQQMQQEIKAGTNRPLTNLEIVEQLRLIIQHLEPRGQKIGMFGEETHNTGSNPIVFREVFNWSEKQEILNLCDKYVDSSSLLHRIRARVKI